MINSFSTLLISKNRSFKTPDTHLDRTQLIRYTTFNFTYEANEVIMGGRNLFWSCWRNTFIQGWWSKLWCEHLVTGVGGTGSRELWPVVTVKPFSYLGCKSDCIVSPYSESGCPVLSAVCALPVKVGIISFSHELV